MVSLNLALWGYLACFIEERIEDNETSYQFFSTASSMSGAFSPRT
jgi:hypothetical protein